MPKTHARLMELQDWHVDVKVREREWDAGTGEDSSAMLCCVLIDWPICYLFECFGIGLNMHFTCKNHANARTHCLVSWLGHCSFLSL